MYDVYVNVRRHLLGVSVLLPLCGRKELQLKLSGLHGKCLPTETSCQSYYFNHIKVLESVIIQFICTICSDKIGVDNISISLPI